MNFSGGETFWRIWARSHGHTFSFSRKISGGSHGGYGILQQHMYGSFTCRETRRGWFTGCDLPVGSHDTIISFVLFTIYDALYERTSVFCPSWTLAELGWMKKGWMTWRRRRISDWLRHRSWNCDRHVNEKGHAVQEPPSRVTTCRVKTQHTLTRKLTGHCQKEGGGITKRLYPTFIGSQSAMFLTIKILQLVSEVHT